MTSQEITTLKKRIGRNVKRIRESKGLSLREVSYNCSIGHSRISEIEHGKHDMRISTLVELAEGLGVEVAKLLE